MAGLVLAIAKALGYLIVAVVVRMIWKVSHEFSTDKGSRRTMILQGLVLCLLVALIGGFVWGEYMCDREDYDCLVMARQIPIEDKLNTAVFLFVLTFVPVWFGASSKDFNRIEAEALLHKGAMTGGGDTSVKKESDLS